jgi:acyl transferase domain-containing protein
MFPGQGAQRVNMGRELYETEPVYRDIIDTCAHSLTPELGLDLREVLFPPVGMTAQAEQQIVETRITQPALFVTEYAVARLWMSWGIQPAAMIGHSVGEYVAACLAGVFSLDDGLRLIAERGRLVQQQPKGSMLAVMAREDAVRPLLDENVSIAAVNAPSLCVASGPDDAIAALEKTLVSAKKMFRRLQTSHAFHSAMMDPVMGPFSDVLRGVRLSPPRIPFVSNLTATWIGDDEATSPLYWAQHLRQAVRFSDGIAGLVRAIDDVVFLEAGPGSTLTKLTREHRSGTSLPIAVPSLSAGDQESDLAAMLGALGRLWQEGVEADWAGFYKSETRRRLHLPGTLSSEPL